jgi:HSP20 family protein
MLKSLKETGKSIGHEISRAWESLSEGWREMLSRSGDALTHFAQRKTDLEGDDDFSAFPRWGLLAGEVEETAKDLLVRIEVPGMRKEDCQISIEGNLLLVKGEKHSEREHKDSTYHVRERAYGAFERSIHLPHTVDKDKAHASYKDGVLMVRLPKLAAESSRSIPVA